MSIQVDGNVGGRVLSYSSGPSTSVLFRPRRRHHRHWRSTADRLPALPRVQVVQEVHQFLARQRRRALQEDRVGPVVLGILAGHLGQVVRCLREDLVGHSRQGILGRQGCWAWRLLVVQALLAVRRVLACQHFRALQVCRACQGFLGCHFCQGRRVFRSFLVILGVLVGLGVLLGMGCMGGSSRRHTPVVDVLVCRELQAFLAYRGDRSCRGHLLFLGDRVGSSFRILVGLDA